MQPVIHIFISLFDLNISSINQNTLSSHFCLTEHVLNITKSAFSQLFTLKNHDCNKIMFIFSESA